ncbi:MAG: hypothetical protein ACLFNQ_05995 [Spirochaetaceae bacterium]
MTLKRLAGRVQRSGFGPEVIGAIGTGGFIPGCRILLADEVDDSRTTLLYCPRPW